MPNYQNPNNPPPLPNPAQGPVGGFRQIKAGGDFKTMLSGVRNINDGVALIKQLGGTTDYGIDPNWTAIVDHLQAKNEAPVTPMSQVKAKMAPAYGPMQVDPRKAALQNLATR